METYVSINVGVDRRRIESGHKTTAAGRTYWILAVSSGESRALGTESVQVRGSDMGITESADCVVALLVSANPQDVRMLYHVIVPQLLMDQRRFTNYRRFIFYL